MIIVTGGAGFIGSNIVAALQKNGYKDIAVVDTLGSGDKWKNLNHCELAAIVPPTMLEALLEENAGAIEAIIHMAGAAHGSSADEHAAVNFEMSWRLWEHAALMHIPFIYSSSSKVYGTAANGCEDDDSLSYLNKLRACNPEGWSKLLFDRKVAREVQEGRPTPPQYIGLRLFEVYGPHELHLKSYMNKVSLMLNALSKHETYMDLNAGACDYVWVEDVANIVIWLLKHPNVKGMYNICTGELHTPEEVIELTTEIFPIKETRLVIDDEAPYDIHGPGEECSMRKLREAGYDAPMTSLADGIRQYVERFYTARNLYR